MAGEPPLTKKAKFEHTGLRCTSPRPVLAEEYVRDCKTGNVLQIILCRVSEASQEDNVISLEDLFQGTSFNLKGLGQPVVTDVPLHQPLTRKQFQEASQLWPTNFHEDKYISKVMNGELFDRESLANIVLFMRVAVQAAVCAKEMGMLPVGAVIVDPQRNKVVAVAHDLCCDGHPLQHATMVCIDLVAHSQFGGAWNLNCEESGRIWKLSKEPKICDQKELHVSCTVQSPNRTMCKSCNTNKQDSIGKKEQFQERNSSEMDSGCDQIKATSNRSCNTSGPYLCTGYDIYITREPCVMCAMALVHSRIRRVFYGCSSPNYGALGSRYKLHTQIGLNHHYEVFSGVLEDECKSVLV